MRISLLTKFFLSFLITGAVLVAVLISLIQFYGVKNFSDYVAQKDYRQLDSLVTVLEAAYAEKGSWEFLTDNRVEWHKLLRKSGIIPEDAPIPPPPRGLSGQRGQRVSNELIDVPSHEVHLPPPWAPPTDLPPRITLMDRGKTIVMGRHRPDSRYLRPVTDQETVVGYLGFNRAVNLSHPLDLEFLKQQKKIFLMAGALFLACSVLVSLGLAFHLLSPIKRLSLATRDLGQRKFDTRITLKTQDELGRLAGDFNRMAVTLEDYEKRQVQWLSDISHELRTPLSILKGELEAVQDGIRPLRPETIDTLHGEVGHLIRLVSDLHDISMAEARMMAIAPGKLDLSSLLEDILNRFHPRFAQKGFDVDRHIQPGLIFHGDNDRLTQLFSNLLENALSYTAPPARASIRCRRLEGEMIINIENSGPGVPSQLLPRLFDRLFRADASRNRKHGGSGLGLAICKHIVTAHGGRIQALQSAIGGINMEIRLPETQGDNS